MKIIFLKDASVDILTRNEDHPAIEKLIRSGEEFDVAEIEPMFRRFADIHLSSGDVIFGVKNDCFKVVEE